MKYEGIGKARILWGSKGVESGLTREGNYKPIKIKLFKAMNRNALKALIKAHPDRARRCLTA
jgi:hypothetical protein